MIKNFINFITANFLIILFEIFLFIIILLFRKGLLILGGEGNYFLNPSNLFNFDGYSWKSLESAGYPNPLINYSFIIFHLIAGLGKIGMPFNLINLFLVFLFYSGPLLSMYWLTKKVFKLDSFSSTLVSLFYIANPFSVFHLQGMMFWNIAPLIFLPIFFGILFLHYNSNAKLFLYFGIACFVGAFSFANIPYLGIFQIFVLISLLVIPFIKNNEFRPKELIQKLIIVELGFILFNAWWLINIVRIQVQDIGTLYTKDFAISWAKYAIGDGGIMQKLFAFKALIPIEKGYFFSDFYNNGLVNIVLILPFLAVIFLLIYEKNKNISRNLSILSLILLVIIFLNKGVNKPFALIYIWMLEKIPFFIIFKSPLEKFSLLFLFFFTITISVLYISKKKILNIIFCIYLLIAIIPFVTLNFMPDFSIGINQFVSRKFLFKQEYKQVIERLNSDKLYYRYLSLPGSLNYQVTMANHENKYYRGMDPLLYAINKPFIAAYSGPQFNILYRSLSDENIENIMGAFSIRKIMLNSDIIPSFGFLEKESPKQLETLFSRNMKNEQSGNIGIYTLNSYIPIIYTPTREIYYNDFSNDPNIGFSKMASSIFKYGSVVIPENNTQPTENKIVDLLEENRPTIEFKKINEVKYRVVIHELKQEIPLIFNETFNKGWKLYQTDKPVQFNDLGVKYEGNSKDSATREELATFLNKKVISNTMDEEGKNNFISKSFNKTIQNDNLKKGTFYETWSHLPIEDSEHMKVNGYANSWFIDPEKICAGNDNCIKNPDGSYDMEFVIEFWPQRFFYLGILISGSALIGSIIYLAYYYWRRYRKIKNA